MTGVQQMTIEPYSHVEFGDSIELRMVSGRMIIFPGPQRNEVCSTSLPSERCQDLSNLYENHEQDNKLLDIA
jgi:hypothetical protein